MARVDDFLAKPPRPEIEIAPDGGGWVDNDGNVVIEDGDGRVGINRDSLPALVDWIIDTYGITPTGFERKGGA